MNNMIRISLRAAAAVLAVILASSCIFEKENPSAEGKVRRVMVQIGISTDGGMATKAEAEATDAENVVNSLRVYAYDNTTKNLCGYLHVDNVTGVSSSASKAYMMDIRLPYSQMNTTRSIVFKAVANAESISYTGDLDIEEIYRDFDGAITFTENIAYASFDAMMYEVSQNYGKTGEDAVAMPMYCQTEPIEINLAQTVTSDKVAGNAADHAGHVLSKIIPIELTRPMAKIEVYAAEASTETASGDSDAGIQIESVKLVNAVAEGKLFPSTATTPAGTTAQMTVVTSNVTAAVVEADKATPEKYTLVTDAYYIAENASGTTFSFGETTANATLATEAAGATALKIGYKVSATAETEYGYVVMPPIARNTWYKVLARITANGKLAFDLNVLDWVPGGEVDVDFDNVVAHDESYGFKWFKGKTEVTSSVANNTYTFSSAAYDQVTCKFKLTAPIGGKWYATLAGGDIQKYSIEGGSGDIEGGEMYFTIKTLTNNFDGESPNQVNLVITAVNTVGKSNVIDDFSYIIKQSQTN